MLRFGFDHRLDRLPGLRVDQPLMAIGRLGWCPQSFTLRSFARPEAMLQTIAPSMLGYWYFLADDAAIVDLTVKLLRLRFKGKLGNPAQRFVVALNIYH